MKNICVFFYEYDEKSKESFPTLYAFYGNIQEKFWHLFKDENNKWLPQCREDLVRIFPRILVLHQNRITKIIERENSLVFTQLLEGFKPELGTQREELHEQFNGIAKEYQQILDNTETNYKKNQNEDNPHYNSSDNRDNKQRNEEKKLSFVKLNLGNQTIERFLELSEGEINNLKKNNTEAILNKLESYLKQSYQDRIRLGKKSILNLMKSGQQGLRYLYIGLIADILEKK